MPADLEEVVLGPETGLVEHPTERVEDAPEQLAPGPVGQGSPPPLPYAVL